MNPCTRIVAYSGKALHSISRIKSVNGYPSGKNVASWLRLLMDFDWGTDERVELMAATFNRWTASQSPIWWVDDALEDDLANTPLPSNISFTDVPWPFPSFALVTRDSVAVCSFPALQCIDPSTGEFFQKGIILYTVEKEGFLGYIHNSMTDKISDLESLVLDPGVAGEQHPIATDKRWNTRHRRLLIGAALLLSTYTPTELESAETVKRYRRHEHQRAPGKESNDLVEPPWLYNSMKKVKSSSRDSELTGTSKSPHWRRAHWRMQRVGTGRTERRMTWVRHTFIGDE